MPGHQIGKTTTGVDYVRSIMPFQHLNKLKGFDVTILTPAMDRRTTVKTWLNRAKEYDVFVMNYNNNPKGFAAMGCMAKKMGKKIVMDLDDNLWGIKPDNSAYHAYKKGSDGLKVIKSMLDEVDYVTCTNSYLKNVICHNTEKDHGRVGVLPNFVDLDLYKYRGKPNNNHQIVLFHYGSTSHFEDLANEGFMKGMDKVMENYPNVVFKTIGAYLSKYKYRWGKRYLHGYGDGDIYKWVGDKFPEFMAEADIMVVPLIIDNYTRCKSSIKYIESSSAKMPGVWQKIRQYKEVIKDGHNGFLADYADEWYEAIKKLIEDVELRRKIGENAFNDVKKNWTIKTGVKIYADFFKKVTA